MKPLLTLLLCAFATLHAAQPSKPNIVLLFADDISARELPIYGSTVWSPPPGGDTSDIAFRAKTPVLDRLASEGCCIKTAWAAVVCSPSRAMMMTGRYAHRHKWWENGDIGTYTDKNGKRGGWPLYESSPNIIGQIGREGAYGTFWAGKTQMANSDLQRFGFDEGAFTPGQEDGSGADNPYTDFALVNGKVDGVKTLINADTGKSATSYAQDGWYWKPFVSLMNQGGAAGTMEWWPNTPESQKNYGLNTFGPDVELDFIFEYMTRQTAAKKPFFIYHTSHLGHDAFDWLHPESTIKWPGTPIVTWDGKGYTRTTPNVTGDNGVYDTHGTVTEPGIHHHINYLDYQVWLYQNKIKELGIADNTVFIFCADNGTWGYGKNSAERQKGTHVPLIIFAPGMTKHGMQDVLVNIADMLPTIAELAGVTIPKDYEVNGESLVPFLFTDKPTHRDWIYGYMGPKQIIRGTKVMKDGNDKWWNVETTPADLISYEQIKDWKSVSQAHRDERDKLKEVLPRFGTYATEHNAPGEPQDIPPTKRDKAKGKGKAVK